MIRHIRFIILASTAALLFVSQITYSQKEKPIIQYTISTPQPATQYYQIDLALSKWQNDTLTLKMPQWMPGYYQIMNYAKAVEGMNLTEDSPKRVSLTRVNDNTWKISGAKNAVVKLKYKVKADKKFVANSYLDATHGYMVTGGALMYIEGHLDMPVSVKIISNSPSARIATGLTPVPGTTDTFTASDFDILYDCPILTGDLEELPSFKVRGVEHRFIGYTLGTFDKVQFMDNLRKVVETAVDIIGEIPYKQYTFIAIGPSRGGIEHLNNTTFGFDGNSVNTPEGMKRMLNFLAHEYFHHYNVKRIRPFELGPFDYEKGSRTNLLWVSEGLSVYYEYLIVKRAGLTSDQGLFESFEENINAHENNPGKEYQSLVEASYATWSDGPFGTQGEDAGKAISYYDKGPVFGLILDLAIRQRTANKKSLDDIMRLLYWDYYKKLGRGFTDAEFQQTCETIAGASLKDVFEYVYTTAPIDYNTYLGYAGLKLEWETPADTGKKKKCHIQKLSSPDALQATILTSWLGTK